MPDHRSDAARLEAPAAGAVHRGATVTLTVAPPRCRLSLRGRDAAALAAATGFALPTRIGEVSEAADGWAVMLGPDEWAVLAPAGTAVPDAAGQPLSVVDVSARAVGIEVAGPGAAALLGAGCPLDLARMAPGRGTRTVFETVEVVLVRLADDAVGPRWRVEVWRSFSAWLWAALVAAA